MDRHRTRLSPKVGQPLRGWLVQAAQAHAVLLGAVRLLGQPEKAAERAGGQSNAGDVYAARVAAGDPSVLHDALVAAADIIETIRRDVAAHMDDVEPTSAAPGSVQKLAVLAARAAGGRSLFCDADSPTDVS